MPTWGADLSELDFDDIVYYARPMPTRSARWEDVPANIKETFERLGIPEAERKFLAGVGRPVRLGGGLPQPARGAHRARG